MTKRLVDEFRDIHRQRRTALIEELQPRLARLYAEVVDRARVAAQNGEDHCVVMLRVLTAAEHYALLRELLERKLRDDGFQVYVDISGTLCINWRERSRPAPIGIDGSVK